VPGSASRSVDGHPLAADDVVALADGHAVVALGPPTLERAAASFAAALALNGEQPVYGRTTGVGANRSTPAGDLPAHALGLFRSHATAAGPVRSRRRVRAMLAVRLAQLAAGGSGLTPVAITALAEMLNRDSLPVVREFGSLGTGDLPALAALALALCGDVALEPALPPELISEPAEVLSAMSSNAATIGDAALAVVDLRRRARASLRVAALTWTAVDGNAEAFDEVVDVASPLPGVAEVCAQLRALLGDLGPPARVQDPYGLRALPQVHGAFVAALDRLTAVVIAMANAPAENPLVLPGHGVRHQGAFHAVHLGQALDAVTSAAAQSAQLSLARLALLLDPAYTGLTPFLAVGPPGASGLMILEYVAGSALVRMRSLATPAGIQSISVSRGAEDDASCAAQSAHQALETVAAYEVIIACELLAAVRALRLRGREPAVEFAQLSEPGADVDLSADLERAQQLLLRLV
jgi:histidine ammonia-lyase